MSKRARECCTESSCSSQDLHAAITKMSKQWDADADAGSATHGVNKYALSMYVSRDSSSAPSLTTMYSRESISFRELCVNLTSLSLDRGF